jgi:hypothetical protein
MKELYEAQATWSRPAFASHSNDVCWEAKSENARVLQRWRDLLSRGKEAGNGMEEMVAFCLGWRFARTTPQIGYWGEHG